MASSATGNASRLCDQVDLLVNDIVGLQARCPEFQFRKDETEAAFESSDAATFTVREERFHPASQERSGMKDAQDDAFCSNSHVF
jgi:hypothetical protein